MRNKNCAWVSSSRLAILPSLWAWRRVSLFSGCFIYFLFRHGNYNSYTKVFWLVPDNIFNNAKCTKRWINALRFSVKLKKTFRETFSHVPKNGTVKKLNVSKMLLSTSFLIIVVSQLLFLLFEILGDWISNILSIFNLIIDTICYILYIFNANYFNYVFLTIWLR